jgi:Flp pilus assembly protein TadG
MSPISADQAAGGGRTEQAVAAPDRPWGHRDRGSSALELVIGVLGWTLVLAVLAAGYQFETSGDDVSDAAAQAARAATLTADPTTATQVAQDTARTRLRTGACEPGTVTIQVAVGGFRAGSTVHVSVSCRTNPPIGPTRRLTATADDVIDRYRGGL